MTEAGNLIKEEKHTVNEGRHSATALTNQHLHTLTKNALVNHFNMRAKVWV